MDQIHHVDIFWWKKTRKTGVGFLWRSLQITHGKPHRNATKPSPSQKTFNAMIEGSSREKARVFFGCDGMRLENPARLGGQC